jgi:hypothetical protein
VEISCTASSHRSPAKKDLAGINSDQGQKCQETGDKNVSRAGAQVPVKPAGTPAGAGARYFRKKNDRINEALRKLLPFPDII